MRTAKMTYGEFGTKKTSSSVSNVGRPVKGFGSEADRIERIKRAKKEAFLKYIVGFGKRAFEIKIYCPECGTKSMIATASYTNQTGNEVLLQEVPASLENLKAAKCFSNWKCECCGHTAQKTVSFEELRKDFNNPVFKQ